MPSPTAEQPEQIRELFNRIAPHYDDLNQKLSLGLHRVWKQMTVRWANVPRGGQALDLCCGSGDLAVFLARRVGRQGHVIGLDFSPAMLSIAGSRSRRMLPGYSLEWVLGDALALPFADHRFDGITMGYGLRNVTDIPQALREIKRVLKPGCRAAILDFHRPTGIPLLEQFQRWYLNTQVVSQAQILGLGPEYAYIDPSLDRFPSGEAQRQMALRVGFARAKFYSLVWGMMGVLVLEKSS
ncbi:bifunctional demethylmenaquinone methyltransferase/2-methoxy-6-polyprenyl-1,4-benzoquinol methylase UbiE [Synechococcus sp. Nb3U1]|uniref:bifunctional demethylmenaquinone methyltransferase/2-methoxy-6-polyprenyl-1,4-benzoquinol methylase UbiE n=1 Tax=Synechococcus sp. Nb3U1 TaxID=1914529 RepID=UPI001F261FDB|nr:bifunctional demethylmenaquinone methyltransferase/2-methoxy-6-polyprenyl-1,4-benzoquinol methylase UbiE [Synechococcus sp. Nb3U1]MCF2971173.1 bifunctional demethylmenaquinone methyltransferase/2-methoxy-6-polyprenyl-1,4-benzoquinol methylase UbiE [Synechococcus sp. Nb3U1]